MKLKIKSTLVLFLLICFSLSAQEAKTIKGQVVSKADGLPVPGVNILLVGTTTGTSTDFDGNYQIQAKQGDILQFSYLGFGTQVITVGDNTTINVTLVEDANALDEIVVVGYGTQKRKNLTGAISKVKNENLDKIAVARIDDALVGQISGVNIQATEGEAGSAPTIRIRGTGSITSEAGPLIVVDGIAVDSDFLGNLDMNDVESFDVLKDASSGAIYGARGGNGVILITTKNGKEGKTKFTYNTFTGFKEGLQNEDMYFSVRDWADRELAATGALSDKTQYKLLIGVDESWQDIIIDGGTIESHSFAARGGSQRTKFSASLNYLHDEGVLLTDDFKRYSMRLKVDSKVGDDIRVGANISPSYSGRRRFDGSTHDILRQPPWLPLYHDANTIRFVDRNVYPDVEIGDYAVQRHFDNYDLFGDGGETDISTTSNTNPGAKVLERDRNDYKFKLFGSFYGEYKITDGLKFKTTLGGDYSHTRRDRWQGVEASRNGVAATQLDISNFKRVHIVSDNVFTYNKVFGNHDLNVVAGFSAEKWDYEVEAATGIGYTSDLVQTLSAANTISEATSEEYKERLLSYFGRVNYAYDDKYLLSLSARRDGYSAFGKDSKWGFFPAASAGWIMTNEEFLDDSKVLNFLKLRFSYGVTGNNDFDIGSGDFRNQINSYPYLSLIGASSAVFNNSIVNGFNPLNIANSELGWEKSVEFNPAIDFGLFNNRISGSVDYYRRTSEDLLLDVPVSVTTGFPNALANRGKVENRGWEFELRTKNIAKPNFQWNTTFIAARNENELLDFAESNGLITNVDTKRAAEWINLVGNPISSFYGWVVDRDIPAEYIARPWERIGQTNREVFVKDLNGDGVIDDDDKTILGNPYPDLVWSITNEFKIGNFDMSFLFQGSHGAEIRNIGDQYIFRHFGSSSVADGDAAVADGLIGNTGFIKEKIFTDDIIKDASYISLRTVSLGFNFPESLLSDLFITNARVYVTGQNLIYIWADDYTGLNPESINDTSPINYGYQRVGSPINQTISLGLNVNF
ncbi:TonB-dependent receptor [uncultured Winogradskyella sp.]|uniref:SusC/RagA family TonB-linked outer membrane protein n=1 Tax=uncultured Winogradskyella sp. TaxID=395353 RepID=UPI00261AA4A8|nr:TonB-dependent receptor [uncultured Winogradskyella sp.]